MNPDNPVVPRRYHDKEVFVTGHTGTTLLEIVLLCLVIPFGLELYYILHARYFRRQGEIIVAVNSYAAVGSTSTSTSSSSGRIQLLLRWWKKWKVLEIILEFATLVMPMLLVQTSLVPEITGPLGLAGGMAMLTRIGQHFLDVDRPPPPPPAENKNHHLSFLSIHRSCVYLLTTIAILAVDFPIFPRRYCKTEVSGYGWMDLGAASFIIIAGWTSALSSDSLNTATATITRTLQTRKNEALESGRTEGNNMKNSDKKIISATARKAIMKCGPLLLIGFVRLATNKGLEYQEHVSEYGVHWNFFFTLCLVEGSMVVWKSMKAQLLFRSSTAATTIVQLPLDCILGMMIMVPYQLFLSYYGGQDYIVDGSRRCSSESYGNFLPAWFISGYPFLCNIFVANREGILGVLGYLSLRLFSEAIARRYLVPLQKHTYDRSDREVLSYLQKNRLLYMSIALWTVHLCLTFGLDIPTSRRSTNASFILWALSHNVTLLCLIRMFMSKMQRAPPLLEAVNRFGLAVFLSSNILTGLVNLTFDTLHTSDGMAMLILTVYLMLVCGFALFLDAVKMKNVDQTLKVE